MALPRKPVTMILRKGAEPREERPTKMLTVKLFEEEHERFMRLAQHRDVPLSEIVRFLLVRECERDGVLPRKARRK